MASSSTLLQVFFGLPIEASPVTWGLPPVGVLGGLPQPSTSSSTALLSVCYSYPNVLHDQTISTLFSLIYVQGSPPHKISSYDLSLVIMSCHLTLDMYLDILWLQLASSPSSLSVSAQISGAYSNAAGLTHAQKYFALSFSGMLWFTSKLTNSLNLLQAQGILSLTADSRSRSLLRMKSNHEDDESCPLFPDYLLPPPISMALPQLPSHMLYI